MRRGSTVVISSLMLTLFWALVVSDLCYGAEKSDMGGWEWGGPYNRLYVASERDKFKGTVLEIKDVTPLPGMSPGVALLVRGSDGDTVEVHLGPRWFIDPKKMGIKRGDKVTLKGCWAEVGNKEVFLASKVQKGANFEFKVRRSRDGMPYWTMSPEELAKEKAGD
jgi:hypothetical protein